MDRLAADLEPEGEELARLECEAARRGRGEADTPREREPAELPLSCSFSSAVGNTSSKSPTAAGPVCSGLDDDPGARSGGGVDLQIVGSANGCGDDPLTQPEDGPAAQKRVVWYCREMDTFCVL